MGDYTPPADFVTPEKEITSVTLTVSGDVRTCVPDRVAATTDVAAELSLDDGR